MRHDLSAPRSAPGYNVAMPDYVRKFVGLILLVWTIGWVSILAL